MMINSYLYQHKSYDCRFGVSGKGWTRTTICMLHSKIFKNQLNEVYLNFHNSFNINCMMLIINSLEEFEQGL